MFKSGSVGRLSIKFQMFKSQKISILIDELLLVISPDTSFVRNSKDNYKNSQKLFT